MWFSAKSKYRSIFVFIAHDVSDLKKKIYHCSISTSCQKRAQDYMLIIYENHICQLQYIHCGSSVELSPLVLLRCLSKQNNLNWMLRQDHLNRMIYMIFNWIVSITIRYALFTEGIVFTSLSYENSAKPLITWKCGLQEHNYFSWFCLTNWFWTPLRSTSMRRY